MFLQLEVPKFMLDIFHCSACLTRMLMKKYQKHADRGRFQNPVHFRSWSLETGLWFSTASAGKETQIILFWQHFCSVLQFFLFQLSSLLSCLDFYVFQQNNWVNQGPTIFPSSHEEKWTESHTVPPITVPITSQFLQLAEPWEEGLRSTMVFASLLTLGKHPPMWQQNSGPRDAHCNCCTWLSKSSFFHSSHGIYMYLRAMSKGPEFLTFTHQVITSLIVIT